MTSAIDKFFDKVEEALDGTIPRGRLGFAGMATSDKDGKPMLVWHFAMYKHGLVCEPEVAVPNASYSETAPRGGYVPFCLKCLRSALENLRE